MTPESVREYAEAIRHRHLPATKAQKGKILEELCLTTGYRYETAIRPLRQTAPLQAVWEASGQRQLPASGVLSDERAAALRRRYERLNPVRLRREVEAALEKLWGCATSPRMERARRVDRLTSPPLRRLPSG